jgi:hypothetical protein
VNGFLYSVTGFITSTAVGLYPAGVPVALAAGAAGRLPRASPEPRVAPKEPNAGGGLTGAAAFAAGAASAGALAEAGKSAGA